MTAAALKGIDHTLVGVRDLEAARRTWERLGFTVTPRGRHIGWGTANYCIMFDKNYIELLGIVDPTLFTNNLDKFLAVREGLLGLAFASDDVEATKARLVAAGLHPDGPKDLKRLLELPEGTVVPEFRLLYLPKEETPDLSAFVCCHLTPELVRRPEWLLHPNGASGLLLLTVLSEQPDRSNAAYRPLLPEPTPFSCRLFFTDRDGFQRIYPGLGDWPTHAAPIPVAMTIAVDDCRVPERWLRNAGFTPQMRIGGDFWLRPEEANGVILEFYALR